MTCSGISARCSGSGERSSASHLTGPQADELKPERPPGRAALQAFYQRASRDLGQILAASAPDAADLDLVRAIRPWASSAAVRRMRR